MAAKLDRRYAGHGTQLHAAISGLPGIGAPGRGRSRDGKGDDLRPGSNLVNVALPPKNASPAPLTASEWIRRACVAARLPER